MGSVDVLDSNGTERMVRIFRHRLLNIVSGVKSANSLLASELDDRLTAREREYFPLITKNVLKYAGWLSGLRPCLGRCPKRSQHR